ESAADHNAPPTRRFHAQPVACPGCGPQYRLLDQHHESLGNDALQDAARLLAEGQIVAVKGIGGYHLACDADNPAAVKAVRDRKYRKDQAFAVMARDLAVAEETVELSAAARALLLSSVRPIVLAPGRIALTGIAP